MKLKKRVAGMFGFDIQVAQARNATWRYELIKMTFVARYGERLIK